MRSDLPVTKLAENVYLLNEFDGTNCYLVVGSEKALLIDCGTGFCDIRGAAEKLTDLPIILAATHGHGDHIGGAGQFEEIYIHRADCEMLNKAQMSLLFRKVFLASNAPVKSHGFKMGDVKPGKYKTKIIPMNDGHIFDLGERLFASGTRPDILTAASHLSTSRTKSYSAATMSATRCGCSCPESRALKSGSQARSGYMT